MIRTCKKCGKQKDLELFRKRPEYTYGRCYVCIECDKKEQLARYYKRPKPTYKKLELVEGENWMDIDGYVGRYQVSDLGNVKSIGFGDEKILKGVHDEDGYLRISLSIDGNAKNFSIHRLVAQAFIPNPENKSSINHKKGIKDDNRATELEWVTTRENNQHASRIGLSKSGEDHKWSILKEKDVLEILTSKETTTQLSKRTGWRIDTISKIRTRKNWKNIKLSPHD